MPGLRAQARTYSHALYIIIMLPAGQAFRVSSSSTPPAPAYQFYVPWRWKRSYTSFMFSFLFSKPSVCMHGPETISRSFLQKEWNQRVCFAACMRRRSPRSGPASLATIDP
jgi:hypothetical protein